MKKSWVNVIVAVCLLGAATAAAQEEAGEEKWRNFEMSITGGLAFPSGEFSDWNDTLGAKTGVSFGISGGYYFTERICAGAYFDYNQFKINEPNAQLKLDDLNYKMYKVGGYVKYALTGESNFEPYGKLSAGADFAKFATWTGPTLTRMREVSYDPELSLGLEAGVLYYTSEFGGIFLQVGYYHERLKDNIGESFGIRYKIRENVNYWALKAGISVFFGSEE